MDLIKQLISKKNRALKIYSVVVSAIFCICVVTYVLCCFANLSSKAILNYGIICLVSFAVMFIIRQRLLYLSPLLIGYDYMFSLYFVTSIITFIFSAFIISNLNFFVIFEKKNYFIFSLLILLICYLLPIIRDYRELYKLKSYAKTSAMVCQKVKDLYFYRRMKTFYSLNYSFSCILYENDIGGSLIELNKSKDLEDCVKNNRWLESRYSSYYILPICSALSSEDYMPDVVVHCLTILGQDNYFNNTTLNTKNIYIDLLDLLRYSNNDNEKLERMFIIVYLKYFSLTSLKSKEFYINKILEMYSEDVKEDYVVKYFTYLENICKENRIQMFSN